jgi:hypothetical protein
METDDAPRRVEEGADPLRWRDVVSDGESRPALLDPDPLHDRRRRGVMAP